jgi:ribosomal-protein-serine acetyltransferase
MVPTDSPHTPRPWTQLGRNPIGTMFAVSSVRPPVEIAGSRISARRYELTDAPQLHEAIVQSVEHLLPWMPWAALEPLELTDRLALIAYWLERWENGEDFEFGVFEGKTLVGGCGLHRHVGMTGFEIGYWTRAGETGRGIATDAAGCLIEAAFAIAAVDFVEVHHDVANVASGRIPLHLGFRLVEEREDAAAAPAEVGIERVWRLDRRDWTGHRRDD